MALITVHLRMVSPQGTNDVPYNANGRVDFIPVAHGKYQDSLRAIEKVSSPITDGVMTPVELTPAFWTVTITPAKGNPWPPMVFELVEGMAEPVNLGDLLPETVIDGKEIAKGDTGPYIIDWRDNGDETITFILSDGTEVGPGRVPAGARGRGISKVNPIGYDQLSFTYTDGTDSEILTLPMPPEGRGITGVSDPSEDGLVTISYTDGTTSTIPGIGGPEGPQGPQGIPGPEGPEGPTGPQGVKGDIGPEGPVGPEGPQGDIGPEGPQGRGLTILGSRYTVEELPTTGEIGDGFLVSGDLYVWDENEVDWVNVGHVQGPQGIQGPQGPKGDQGIQGIPGVKGDKGDQGDQGPIGDTGLATVTTVAPGVWMVDQAPNADAPVLEDLQTSVYNKADRQELTDLQAQIGNDLAGVESYVDSVETRVDNVETTVSTKIQPRMSDAPVGVTFVLNTQPTVPSRVNVIPEGWTKVGNNPTPITVSNSGFTTSSPGLYLITISGSYGNGTPTGNYEYHILKNGERVLAVYGLEDISSRSGSCVVQLGPGDIIQAEYYQSSGTAFTLRHNSFNALTFVRIV